MSSFAANLSLLDMIGAVRGKVWGDKYMTVLYQTDVDGHGYDDVFSSWHDLVH